MPTKEMNPSEVKAGENTFLDFCTQHSKKFIIAAVIIAGAALAAMGGLWSVYKDFKPWDSKVLAVVNGENITKEDLNKYIYSLDFQGTPKDPLTKRTDAEKETYLKQLIQNKIVKVNADKLGVTVTEKEVNDEIAKRGLRYDKFKDYQKEVTKDNVTISLLTEKVKQKVLGYKEGQYLLFRFDQYAPEYQSISGQSSQALIDSQRASAQTLANEISGKWSSGQLTYAQASAQLLADSKLGDAAFGKVKLNKVGVFNRDEFETQLNYFDTNSYKGFKENVSSIANGKVSEPFLVQTNANGTYKDFAFAVVKVTNSGGGTSNSYADWLSVQKKELNVRIAGTEPNSISWLKYFASPAYASQPNSIKRCALTGERTDIIAVAWLVTATGDTIPWGDVPFSFSTSGGQNDGFSDLRYTDCATLSTTSASFGPKYTIVDPNTPGGIYARGAVRISDFYNGGGGETTGHFFRCMSATYGHVWVQSTPTVSGAIKDAAKWSHYAPSGWVDRTYSSDGPSGLQFSTEAGTGSANGTTMRFDFKYNPSYVYNLDMVTTADKTEVRPGDTVTFTQTLTNNGGSAVSDVAIRNNLDLVGASTKDGTQANPVSPYGVVANKTTDINRTFTQDAGCYTTGCAENPIQHAAWAWHSTHAGQYFNPGQSYTIIFTVKVDPGINTVKYFGTQPNGYYDIYNTPGSSWTIVDGNRATVKINPAPILTALSCDVASPLSGEAPLAVRIQFTSLDASGNPVAATVGTGESTDGGAIATANALIDPKEITIPGRNSPFVYTYGGAGTYTPGVSRADVAGDDGVLGHWKRCTNSKVTVTDPSNPDGGEQPPTN